MSNHDEFEKKRRKYDNGMSKVWKLWPIFFTLLLGAVAYGTMKEKVNKMSGIVILHSSEIVENSKAIAVTRARIENINKNVEDIKRFLMSKK